MDWLIPLFIYAFVASVTPGPNNIMLTASGANFGFRRSIPHMLGISLGFGFMLVVMGLGLGAVLLAVPVLQLVLKVAGAAYMLWLAWKIAHASAPGEQGEAGASRPMTFVEAAAFQWVNVKAWMMAIGTVAIFVPADDQQVRHLWMAVAVFILVNLPSVSLWTVLGVGIRRFLQNRDSLRLFNLTMAALLVLSLIPMLR